MKKVLFLVLSLVAGLTLAACGNESSNETGDVTRDIVEVTHTITTGAKATTEGTSWNTESSLKQEVTQEFLTNPSRVAIFSYDALDILNYVGIRDTSITKLGVVKSNLPSYLETYNADEYENVGTLFMPDWDALTLFQPQLIIIGSRSSGAYDTLKEQFPNADILDVSLAYGEYSEGLTRNAGNLAKIFPSIAHKITLNLALVTNDMLKIKDVAKDYEALFIMVNGEALSFYGPTGRFAVLHDEFGFIAADANAEEGGSHGNVVGYEYVSMVNPKVLFLLDRGAAIGSESTTNQVLNNSLIKDTEAGKNNNIYTLTGESWYIVTGGFTSTQTMINDIEKFIYNLASINN